MPLETHPIFERPPIEAKLWRYMSLAKFLSLLSRKGLFFANVSKFADTDDFEARLPEPNLEHRSWRSPKDMLESKLAPPEMSLDTGSQDEVDKLFKSEISIRELRIKQAEQRRKFTFVNCWALGESESSIMWDAYGKGDTAVSIVSSLSRIEEVLSLDNRNFLAGMVRYLDYSKDYIPLDNSLRPIVHKRQQYRHEDEFRIVWEWREALGKFAWVNEPVRLSQAFGGAFEGFDMMLHVKRDSALEFHHVPKSDEEINAMPVVKGIMVNIEPDLLIDHVVVSPTTPDWAIEEIKALLSLYGLRKNVVRSQLSRRYLG